MGNNGNCEVCSGNQRNQMDMRRQKAMMYENRYAQNQMMPRMQADCDSCGVARTMNHCDNNDNARRNDGAETCGVVKMNNSCDTGRGNGMMNRTMNCAETCGTTRVNNSCNTCENNRVMNSCDDCGNSRRDELRGMPLAMGYVPWQNFGCTYEAMEGLHAGTIFPELDKPFYGRRGMR